MILPRDLYDASPPERRSRMSNNPTLLYSWWCTLFSAVIIAIRLVGRFIRNQRLFREDKIMALSIVPLLARMAFVHVVLIYGTNNVDLEGLTDPVKIHHRRIGSQMVLVARILYALFIWMAKFTVSEFLKRLTERFWKRGYERGLRCIRIFLVVTFLMVCVATFTECRPTSHYWQVIPDPGPQCRQGYAQLLTMGVADVVTDILLVAFPIPIIVRSSMPVRRKISLVGLFSLSTILIIVTATRMPLVIQKHGLQQFRTVFASSEILAATIVSNAIVLGSFLRDRGIKKQKFRAPSTEDSMERRGSSRRFTNQPCSSDEDLARSLGFRTKPELAEQSSQVPRPAPVVDLKRLSSHTKQGGILTNSNWRFPDQELTVQHSLLRREDGLDITPSPRHGRRVSWFDVGGLLDPTTVTPSPTDSVLAHDFATQPRMGSKASASLTIAGRSSILSPRRSSRFSQQSEDFEPAPRSAPHLQDPGALLAEDCEQEEAQAQSYPQVSPMVAPAPQRKPTHSSPDQASQSGSHTWSQSDDGRPGSSRPCSPKHGSTMATSNNEWL